MYYILEQKFINFALGGFLTAGFLQLLSKVVLLKDSGLTIGQRFDCQVLVRYLHIFNFELLFVGSSYQY